jgi:hypothetical protein
MWDVELRSGKWEVGMEVCSVKTWVTQMVRGGGRKWKWMSDAEGQRSEKRRLIDLKQQ